MPVVLVSSETKVSPTYGDVEAPLFTLVDWQPFGEGAAPPGMRDTPLPLLPPVQEVLPPPKKSIGDDMSDEIVF
jgi:hypothetical protein